MEPAPLASNIGHDLAAKSSTDRILNLVERSCEPEPAFSKILLTELMRSKTSSQQARSQGSTEKYLASDMFSDLDTSPVSLPTKAAQTLGMAYFQFANLSMPLLHEPTHFNRWWSFSIACHEWSISLKLIPILNPDLLFSLCRGLSSSTLRNAKA
jgi:hypothetical protein